MPASATGRVPYRRPCWRLWSSCRHWRIPWRDHTLRISVLWKEPHLVPVQRQRVGVEVLGLCGRRPQSPRGVPEVRESLALHLPLVPPEAPMAKVEGLVRENQGAESLLPQQERRHYPHPARPRRRRARARCSPRGRSCTPSRRTTPNPHPTPPVTGSEPLPLPVSRRARPRSACSEPRRQLRSARGRPRGPTTEGSGWLRDRGSGGCARNDDRAPEKTAAKRDE